MARPKPHFKVHLSLPTHAKTSALHADKEMFGIYTSIGVAAIQAYAPKTNDCFFVGYSKLHELTGARSLAKQRRLLHRLAVLSPLTVTFHAENVEFRFPNLAIKHGMQPENPTVTPPKLDTQERRVRKKNKNKREDCVRCTNDTPRPDFPPKFFEQLMIENPFGMTIRPEAPEEWFRWAWPRMRDYENKSGQTYVISRLKTSAKIWWNQYARRDGGRADFERDLETARKAAQSEYVRRRNLEIEAENKEFEAGEVGELFELNVTKTSEWTG